MNPRGIIRYVGLVCILSLFIAVGLQTLANPAVSAALLAKSNFPKMLRMVGVKYHLRASDYTMITQTTGAVFVAFSLFILLGVGRAFFAFLLALCILAGTAAFHANFEDSSKTSSTDLFHALKNLSIAGALLFVAGSGHRSRRYSQARDYDTKKNQ